MAIELDIDPCCPDDILSELWEIYGDELIIGRLKREGFTVTHPDNVSN